MKPVMGVVLATLALAFCFCSPVAKAWNCPSGQIRQQAPAGTPTNAPYYDVVEGIAFICVPATPPTTPSTGGNSNATSNSTSSAQSSSTARSTSNSNATGGNATAQGFAQGGTATGGNATSGISNSGNSSNTNTAIGGAGGNATATGGSQKQSQSQSLSNSGNSSASADGNGNGNGNTSNSNNTYMPRQTATAVAPTIFPTVPCFKGIGVGAQGPAFGASFGGGKIDTNCAALETARSFLAAGSRVAYCKTMVSTKSAKNAGVTMDDCMTLPEPQITVATPPQQMDAYREPQSGPTPITINIPAPVFYQAPVVSEVKPPVADVAQAAVVNKAIRRRAKTNKPCVTNDTISK